VRAGAAGAVVGIVFGVILSWSGMASPNVIREALLFQSGYLYLFFCSAVVTAVVGQALLRRGRRRALLTGAPIAWANERPARRHIVGSVIFGLGWGIADACPGPIAAQIGQGIGWALLTVTGVVIGVRLYLRQDAPETEPATEPRPVSREALHPAA
jgi:hypothetical protein